MSTSSSVRLHLLVTPHELEDPPVGGEASALSDARGAGADTCPESAPVGCLRREEGKVMYRPADGGEAVAVRLAWALPLSGRGGPVSILLAEKKKEVGYVRRLEDFPDAESRTIAAEELAAGMVLPRIVSIREVKARFGNFYWDVDTDMGPRRFLVTSPENNTYYPRPDALVVKDVSGNCYEIFPVSGLSRESLREMERML